MKHIVLFKFLKNNNVDFICNILDKTYYKLKNEYNVIENYSFSKNILDKDANMDIILFVELKDENSLDSYINHPEHIKFLSEFKANGLCDKAVIDVL